MSIQIDDIIRVQSRLLRNGVDAVQNVWHVKHVTGSPVDDALWTQAVADIIDAQFASIEAEIATNITSLDLLFFNVTQDVTLPDGVWDTFAGGLNGNEPNPPQTSAEIFWRTGAARVIGRKFLPAMTEGGQDDGFWTAGILAKLATIGAALIGSLVTTQGNVTFGTFNVVSLVFNAFLSALIPVDARTQRRRRTGVGA